MTANCPSCEAKYSFSEGSFGKTVWCRQCGGEFRLPSQAAYSAKLWVWLFGALGAALLVIFGVVQLEEYLESKRHPPVPTQTSVELPAVTDQVLPNGKNLEEEAAELLKKAKELIAEKKFEKAKRCLMELLKEYPKSRVAKEARELLEFLG